MEEGNGRVEYRCGTGFDEEHKDTKEFIKSLIQKGVLEDKGGIMDDGAFIFLGGEKHNVAYMSVDEVKELLTKNNIKY